MKHIPWQRLYIGDVLNVLKSLSPESIDLCMTSPPYWGLRDYGVDGQIGLEVDPMQYIERMTLVFDEVKRILRPTGSAYVVLGDTYCSPGKWGGQTKQSINGKRDRHYPEGKTAHHIGTSAVTWVRRKQLALIPSRFAIAMQDQGWILRNDIIWHKTNGLPASVKDRLSNRYEHILHFVKNERYYYNLEAIREPYKFTSLKRFGRLVDQNFTRKDGKYILPDSPKHVQFAGGRIPAAAWLKEAVSKSNETHAKAQLLYKLTRGRIGHGHYGSGKYRGIHSHPVGKNPGDVIEMSSVRCKPWMSTPGHPYTHKPTGIPQNPGDFWSVSTSSYRGTHFSVYPEKLCTKPILSSCPPWVCRKCGTPKREIVASPSAGSAFNIRVRDAQKGTLAKKWGGKEKASTEEMKNYSEFFYKTKETGRVISEGCSCKAGFDAGTVLDPFVGSGTTMKVALDLSRNAIGIDINPEYAALVRRRIPQLRNEDIVSMNGKAGRPLGKHI